MMIGKLPSKLTSGILAAAFSALMLSGCVSAKPEGLQASAAVDAGVAASQDTATGEAQQQIAAQPGYVDPMVASTTSARAGNHPAPGAPAQANQPASTEPAQIGGLITQPTGIAAHSQSIFSTPASFAASANAQGQAGLDSVPAYAPTGKISPALNSVYSASPVPAAMPAPAPAQPVPAQEHSSASPVPGSPDVATASGSHREPSGVPQNMPMAAALFAGMPKKRTTNAAGLTQVAALPRAALQENGAGLAGKKTMTDAFDETHLDDDDDKPTGLMKLASISGMTRVAPNGLVLQTNQVNVGCFKPELIRRIKEVEAHYGRPAIVTSGFRPPHGGATQGSKHYTCEAADIQVKGVTKWDLASYLRSLPDRGGVGTYCHTESVHMDVGEPRDWNWRCRRTGTSS